jgi:phytanoyl-CoA hydroxylase
MNRKDQKTEYDENGYIRVQGFLDARKLKNVQAAVERYEREILPHLQPADYVMEKDGKSVRNLWHMEKHDPFFQELSEDPALIELVTELVNGEPDNAYFCRKPADVLTIWIALDPVTEANGPVTYMTGSHKLGHLDHKPSGVAGNSMGLAELPDKNLYPHWEGLLNPGDALIHHCEVIHFSAPNRTDFPRRGLLMVFRGAHTEECSVLKNAYARGGALAALEEKK